jgi:hypothetical protein
MSPIADRSYSFKSGIVDHKSITTLNLKSEIEQLISSIAFRKEVGKFGSCIKNLESHEFDFNTTDMGMLLISCQKRHSSCELLN